MKLLRILIILFFVSFSFQANAGYNDIDSKTKLIYENFYSKIKIKYIKDKGLSILYVLNDAIDSLNNNGKVNADNTKLFSDLQKLNNEKIFSIELNNKEEINKLKISSNTLLKDYKIFGYNNEVLFKENGVWYTYKFLKKYYFEDIEKLNKESLVYNGLYGTNILVYYEDNKLIFVKDFEKVKLISDDIIYGFPNKYKLLTTLRNNKILDSSRDDDQYLKNLEIISKQITKDTYKNQDKIRIIYDYILNNISYSIDFTMEDYEIFSGIETYINKSGVCEGYVELFNLMLGFNNIKSEIVIGDVIDAADFPQIGHAWVKIGEYYYDITFDDPVGATKTKTFNEYHYYKLPKDIFYTNRFDKGLTPEVLKTETLENRKNLIKTNLSKLVIKYKDATYNLLKPFIFKNKYNLDPIKSITANDIIKAIGYKDLINFQITIDGKIKNIKTLNYVPLQDNTIEIFLEQINYNLDGYMILNWHKDNGETQFIIANNIVYHD